MCIGLLNIHSMRKRISSLYVVYKSMYTIELYTSVLYNNSHKAHLPKYSLKNAYAHCVKLHIRIHVYIYLYTHTQTYRTRAQMNRARAISNNKITGVVESCCLSIKRIYTYIYKPPLTFSIVFGARRQAVAYTDVLMLLCLISLRPKSRYP